MNKIENEKKKEEKETQIGVWSFWNHCFLAREHLSRRIRIHKRGVGKWQDFSYKCSHCFERKKGTRYTDFMGSKALGFDYLCPECYSKLKEEANTEASSETRKKLKELSLKFSEALADCTRKGTCDILAAHHEAMADDHERLTTSFLIEQICGKEKREKYEETKS